jgi:hypothetical protein
MSRTLQQIFTDNPITTNQGADLMYFARSPYSPGNDAGMLFSDFAAQFGAPFTPAALTRTNDTNVTLTLGGTPNTSLLQGVSLTLGWSGLLSPARGGTGVNNGTSTLTLGGNTAFSGAFTFTGTLTGNTSVTFPTSGTLLTAAGAVTSLSSVANQTTVSAAVGAVSVGLASNAVLPGTGGVTLPQGNTASRAGAAGTMRFNTQTSVFEATVDGSTWATIETSATSVTSVSGTLNRITSTGGTTPVIDISASYVGQSSITTLGTIGTGTWQGTVIGSTYGGTGVNNGSSTLTMGGSHTLSGAFASTFTFTNTTNVTFPTSGTLATTSQIPTGAALTKTDDTNVTLTLGGSPTTALVNAASLTLGWTGQLGLTRGGTAASLTASNGGIVYSNATTLAILSGTATSGQMLQSGASTTPAWSTATYPATTTINQILYSSAANVVSGLATANSSVLVTSAGGVPSLSTDLPSGITIGGKTIGIVTPWVAYTPTFTGFGTVTGVAVWSRRVGGNLEIRGSFASGTATATEARITLGFNGTNANITSSSTLLDGNNLAGSMVISVATGAMIATLIKQNVGYINYSLQSASAAGLTAQNGNVLFASGTTASFYASIAVDSFP